MKRTPAPAWRRYLRFWRNDIAEDVDDELRFHIEMRVAEYIAAGMTEDDARRAVAERLGDVEAARAVCIEQGKRRELHARNADFLDSLRSDIRYALHSLGRTPAWAAVALLTIALGVGATTAVFRVADTLIVRPIRYRDASRVFVFRRLFEVENRQLTAPFSPVAVRAFRELARSVEAAAPIRAQTGELDAGADTRVFVLPSLASAPDSRAPSSQRASFKACSTACRASIHSRSVRAPSCCSPSLLLRASFQCGARQASIR